jgi:UDP-N-acetylglucosamine--N-acetylmuramyl-(pentapeptide) pyrophosphoryl-undecaprenol N-acetylglucosamine transferase
MESQVVPAAGLAFETLDVAFLKGRRGLALAKAAARVPGAVLDARRILARHAPTAVVALGGFVCGPVGVAARALGVPLFVLEQNAHAGLTNRWLGRLARRVYTTFEDANMWFPPGRAVTLGNPVRRAMSSTERAPFAAGGPVRLLVVGGSQGARSLNEQVPRVLGEVARAGVALRVRHAAGRGAADAVRARYVEAGVVARVDEYIDDMAAAYADTDLVVCRAGATTIAELTIVGLPAVYVPFPHAADDHQTRNAQSVVAAGGGILLRDDEMSSARPVTILSELLRHPEVLARMGAAARTLSKPVAADNIALDILTSV